MNNIQYYSFDNIVDCQQIIMYSLVSTHERLLLSNFCNYRYSLFVALVSSQMYGS